MDVLKIRNVPQAESLQCLPRVDYMDAFAVDLPAGARPDAIECARAVFDKRSPGVAALLTGITLLLGARRPLHARAGGLGFDIGFKSPEAVRLETLGWAGLVQILVLVDSGRLVVATFITFSGRAGRSVFMRLIRPAHERVVRFLLARAVASWTT